MADILLLPRHRNISLPSSPPPPSRVQSRMESTQLAAERTVESTIPKEPAAAPVVHVANPAVNGRQQTSAEVATLIEKMNKPLLGIDFTRAGRPKPAASPLQNVGKEKLLQDLDDSSGTNLIAGQCCGGGCCLISAPNTRPGSPAAGAPVELPDNEAFRSLHLKLAPLTSRSRLTGTTPVPPRSISFEEPAGDVPHESTVDVHPPKFVQPHPPYDVFSARVDSARELTRAGASKRTYHFDLDVTDYPEEAEGVDFRVGGAIGVVAPNHAEVVEEILTMLEVPRAQWDAPLLLHTAGGRWPTIWGQDMPRSLCTTRRELLTWTVDVQSYAPTKNLLRVLAEHARDEAHKTILLYLCSRQGQAAFCELRTGPYVTLLQLLHAFPSSKPPLDHLLPSLPTLMPRFYSLSSDPHYSRREHHRIIEIAVTVHEEPEPWRATPTAPAMRTGVGSGFFERQARRFIDAPAPADVRIPMFRGLMANPLAREFRMDGPMLLIGAGVGVAPFRGFVQRRLQNASCVNKVWVLQGVRDSLLDELYSGEWGVSEKDIKKVVESRVGTGRYVQDEVVAQADLVWDVINALDGRVFVCGSSKGMGEGVEEALVEVAMKKGRLSRGEAESFWEKKKEGLQYVAETW